MSVSRIKQLRKACQAANLDGLILTNLDQVRYATGFTGSAGLLVISPRSAEFYTDFRYTAQAGQQVKGAKVIEVKGGLITYLAEQDHLRAKNRRYGIAAEFVTLMVRDQLQKSLEGCLLVPADDLLLEMGWVKEKVEIDCIKKAVKISDTAFERILNIITPGVRESELAAELEYQMLMLFLLPVNLAV